MWGQGTFFGLSGAVLAAAAALVYYLTSTITSTLRRLGERLGFAGAGAMLACWGRHGGCETGAARLEGCVWEARCV